MFVKRPEKKSATMTTFVRLSMLSQMFEKKKLRADRSRPSLRNQNTIRFTHQDKLCLLAA